MCFSEWHLLFFCLWGDILSVMTDDTMDNSGPEAPDRGKVRYSCWAAKGQLPFGKNLGQAEGGSDYRSLSL